MYTLYFLPGACSLATQVLLRQLDQPFELIHRDKQVDFTAINPVNTVPALVKHDTTYTEGAAIIWQLLNQHDVAFNSQTAAQRDKTLMDIMFANATMHPAYGRLFFLSQHQNAARRFAELFESAAKAISELWAVVESRLQVQPYLGGEQPSAADIMLAVYARWGDMFPVTIEIGPKTQQMLNQVHSSADFLAAVKAEKIHSQEQL